jgi:hypothetical protein
MGSRGTSEYFVGYMDDIRFYSIPLTQAEISTIYNLQKGNH